MSTLGGYRGGVFRKFFVGGGIERGIFFDDEMRKNAEKPGFGLNLTELRLNLVKFS